MSLRKLIRYFYPAADVRRKLPLLPRDYVETNQQRRTDDHRAEMLKMAAVARTDAAARTLLESNQGKTVRRIIRAERRQRRPRRIFATVWKRFIRMW